MMEYCTRMRVSIKTIVMVLIMACVMSLSLPTHALAQEGKFVFDEKNLLTQDQFSKLEEKGKAIAEAYNVGVYVCFTDYMDGATSPTSSQRTNAAKKIFNSKNLGLGDAKDGLLLVIAQKSRDYVTIGHGMGKQSFSSEGIKTIENAVKAELKHDRWFLGGMAYYDSVDKQLAYYKAKGKPQVPLSWMDIAIRLAIVLLLPALITFFIIRKWYSEMKTAREKSEAFNYLDQESVNITSSNDVFVDTSLAVTPRAKKSDGDSSWGSGGGGFSSSGGGKF